LELPAEVEILDTPFDERQDMLREIDRQKRKENPEFTGAFHDKKKPPAGSDKKKLSAAQERRIPSSSSKKFRKK
jgi:ATP-dependent RNA helicase RhlE